MDQKKARPMIEYIVGRYEKDPDGYMKHLLERTDISWGIGYISRLSDFIEFATNKEKKTLDAMLQKIRSHYGIKEGEKLDV